MKVIATEVGYTKNGRVYPGDVFEVPDGKNGKWFSPAPDEADAKQILDPQTDKKVRAKKQTGNPDTFRDMTKILADEVV